MDRVKIEDFARDYPNQTFPNYRTLSQQETAQMRGSLAIKAGLSPDATPLELVSHLSAMASVKPDIKAEDDAFDIRTVLEESRIIPAEKVFINWYRFDDIDEMALNDFAKYFDDLWYPGTDDIDLFDESLGWILSIGYSGTVSLFKF